MRLGENHREVKWRQSFGIAAVVVIRFLTKITKRDQNRRGDWADVAFDPTRMVTDARPRRRSSR